MTTVANTRRDADSSHWYYTDGRPCYELPKKDGSGMKVPTLADARKLNLVPSVTSILRILHKQALVDWLIEQACLAVLTSPRQDGEELDKFVYRVLHTERVQDEESKAARDRGTEMHAGLESLSLGEKISEDLMPWVFPAFQAVSMRGKPKAAEWIVVGDGYAGKVDLIQEQPETGDIWLWDWKTAKKLPDPSKGGAWSEHRLQLAAYAQAWWLMGTGDQSQKGTIRTGNVYISTVEQGKFVICEHDPDWSSVYSRGFLPLVMHWQWANNYRAML